MLQIGDKVEMSEDGKAKYMNEGSNPHDLVGEVSGNHYCGHFPLEVTWKNGAYNHYNPSDLVLHF